MPSELFDLALCRWLGWTWQELMDTPEAVVADARLWMRTEGALAHERAALAGAKGR